jgi:hypothetical protein
MNFKNFIRGVIYHDSVDGTMEVCYCMIDEDEHEDEDIELL